MNLPVLHNETLPLSNGFKVRICASLELCSIPKDAKRIVLGFQDNEYYETVEGPHPIEINLTRKTGYNPWHIAVMASFTHSDKQIKQIEVQLYFNSHHGWFYKPDIERGDLAQPEVVELFKSWDQTFVKLLNNKGFNQLSLTILKTLLL